LKKGLDRILRSEKHGVPMINGVCTAENIGGGPGRAERAWAVDYRGIIKGKGTKAARLRIMFCRGPGHYIGGDLSGSRCGFQQRARSLFDEEI